MAGADVFAGDSKLVASGQTHSAYGGDAAEQIIGQGQTSPFPGGRQVVNRFPRQIATVGVIAIERPHVDAHELGGLPDDLQHEPFGVDLGAYVAGGEVEGVQQIAMAASLFL